MNDIQVRQFLAIVKHMNMHKAAQELYISQPALSLALCRIEKELGVELFYRHGKKLVLSRMGESMISRFKSLREAYEELILKANLFKSRDEESSRSDLREA